MKQFRKNYPYHLKPHKIRSYSVNKYETQPSNKNLPTLLLQSITLNKNIGPTVENQYQSDCQNEILGEMVLPSNKYTKEQNIKIAEELTEKITTLRNPNSNTFKQLVRKRNKTQMSDCETSIISTQRLITDPGIIIHPSLKTDHTLIERQFIFQDGIKYPYKLYMINNNRKHMLRQLFMNNNDYKEDININIMSQDVDKKLKAQINNDQIKKTKQELISKNSNKNAFYSLLALNKVSQRAVKNQYRKNLPQDSRFYLI